MKVSSPCLAVSEAQMLISNNSRDFHRTGKLGVTMHVDTAKAARYRYVDLPVCFWSRCGLDGRSHRAADVNAVVVATVH